MRIVDAQVHLWTGGRRLSDDNRHHRHAQDFTDRELLPEMDGAGVDTAIVVPVWTDDSDVPALAMAGRNPGRLAVFGRVSETMRRKRRLPSLHNAQLGLRITFPEAVQLGPCDPDIAWLWAEAERREIPLMVWAPARLVELGVVATRHSGLRIAVDHLGCRRQGMDEMPFTHLPALLSLARLPNVAVKATALPCYSRGRYPFKDLHEPLKAVFKAFGPERMFWGSDLTRLTSSYRQCVTLFTDELPWLAGRDLDLVMGEALCRWIGRNPALRGVRALDDHKRTVAL